MIRYDAGVDPLCYPGTTVLRNKANLTDQDELDQFEQLMFLIRSEEPLPEGVLDYAHYRAIHHHFFQDVYVWAGEARQIRTAKGGNWFCYPEYIDAEMSRIFAILGLKTTWPTSVVWKSSLRAQRITLPKSMRSIPFARGTAAASSRCWTS